MNSPSMTKGERLEHVSEFVLKNGEVSLDELVERLGVSRMTIHRDLEELENRGVLRKVRNGATARPSSSFESNLEFRMTQSFETKKRLAAHAASLIEPGDVILLDEATTLLPMIPHLSDIEGLTVVSNFLPVQAAVSKLENVRLLGLGGEHIRQYDTFSGPVCEAAVDQLRINRYFTSTTAIDGAIAYHPNAQIASTKKAMMKASIRSYLLVDATKFARTALHKVAGLDEFELILTDEPISAARLNIYRDIAEKFVIVPQVTSSK